MKVLCGCRQDESFGRFFDGFSRDFFSSGDTKLRNEDSRRRLNANWQMVAAPAFVAILGRIFGREDSPHRSCGAGSFLPERGYGTGFLVRFVIASAPLLAVSAI